jgi:hypothetical protein
MSKEEHKLTIKLLGFEFDPLTEKLRLPEEMKVKELKSEDKGSQRLIIQFHNSLTHEERVHLQTQYGLRLVDYIPEFAYIESIDPDTILKLQKDPLFRASVPYEPAFKIAPKIGERQFHTEGRMKAEELWLSAILFPDADINRVVKMLEGFNATKITVIDDRATGGIAQVRFSIASKDELPKIAQNNEIRWIEEVGEAKLDNGTTTGTVQSGIPNVTPIWNAGLHGENQVIGIIDSVVDINHCFFEDDLNNTVGPAHRKVVGLRNSSGSGVGSHGTFVAGIAIGDDLNVPATHVNRGVAWAARLTFGNSNDISGTVSMFNYLSAAAADGATIHTNSWHDEPIPQYSQIAADVDTFVWNNEDNLVLGSSGNVGEQIGPPGTAKNALCVSATRKDPNEMNFGDGNDGPTPDGRRKPEIMAPGCSIISAQSGTPTTVAIDQVIFGFGPICATSWATPAVAGTAALARQYYTEGFYPTGTKLAVNAFNPSGALLKATLLNSTIDATGITGYPSNREGWGLVHLDNVLYLPSSMRKLLVSDIRNANGLSTGNSHVHHVSIGNSLIPLKVTLVWSDPPGAPNSANPIVNNLDLEVISPDGTQTFLGNIFASGESSTGGLPDTVNNVEMVLVNKPAPGEWTIRIVGTQVNVGNPGQGYALVVTGEIVKIITKLDVTIRTADVVGAGTNGRVYLGIGGREFRLDKVGNQFDKGDVDTFTIGNGSNIENPHDVNNINNSSNSYELTTYHLNNFPRYIRFEPQDNDDNWNIELVELKITDSENTVYVFRALEGSGNVWLGNRSGLFLGLVPP